MKDTDEPPDEKEKAHRARSRRNPVQKEASVPVELGCAAPLAQGCVCSPTRKFSKCYTLGFLTEASPLAHSID